MLFPPFPIATDLFTFSVRVEFSERYNKRKQDRFSNLNP